MNKYNNYKFTSYSRYFKLKLKKKNGKKLVGQINFFGKFINAFMKC